MERKDEALGDSVSHVGIPRELAFKCNQDKAKQSRKREIPKEGREKERGNTDLIVMLDQI